MQEKKRRQESNKAKTYVPNGKAEEFIKMVGSDEFFVNMFVAANGVGKSASGAVIVTNIVFGPQNEWFELPLFQNWPYQKKGRIISDPTTIKEKIIPELRKWFPANEAKNIPEANFEESKEGKNYVCKIVTKTGWTIDILSTEQAAKEFESADLGFVWPDEPMPKDKFMATIARMRLGGIIFWTLTPLFFAAWIKDWMSDNTTNGIADYVEAEMEDNCKVHGVRGILEHSNIKRMIDSMPEEEKQARAFGKFGHLIGRIHGKYSRKIHGRQAFQLNEKDYCVYKALDTHGRVEDHVLYMAVDRGNRKFIVGEILGTGHIRHLYEKMKAFEAAMNFRMEGRLIDPSAFNKDQHSTDKSIGDQLADLGEVYAGGSKDLISGIRRTNDALDYEVVQGKMVRAPELTAFDNVPVFDKQMEGYVWSEWKGAAKDDKKLSSKPRDKDDHQPENLHRLLLSEPIFVPYQSPYASTYDSLEDDRAAMDPYDR